MWSPRVGAAYVRLADLRASLDFFEDPGDLFFAEHQLLRAEHLRGALLPTDSKPQGRITATFIVLHFDSPSQQRLREKLSVVDAMDVSRIKLSQSGIMERTNERQVLHMQDVPVHNNITLTRIM